MMNEITFTYEELLEYASLSKMIDYCARPDMMGRSSRKITQEMLDKQKKIESFINNWPTERYTDRRCKAFLQARCLLGLTMDETADALFISRDTAYRCLKRIKQVLQKKQ